MKKTAKDLWRLFDWLDSSFDAGKWWPAETRFEILVGAVLTQNTAWTNVEKAIVALRSDGLLEASALLAAEPERVAELIYPTGYRNTKAVYLREISRWFLNFDGSVSGLGDEDVRSSLLSVRGVGDETADDILLYAYNRRVFIYDLYCRRFFKATGIGDFSSYRQAKTAIDPAVREAEFSLDQLQLFHGLIVEWGKQFRANPLLLSESRALQ
ncbi:hypothetical protein BM477_06335 [Boudabousia marimammalium]|uniref:HhH-GPD domain-containing protein n=2 Tax=Boudabousia marimammalium TaxID=156892 RepID=A0A1Q5PM55_9ACTO|nr:hypothetical protein BM477_06335 [Boudabousia marimammalium]